MIFMLVYYRLLGVVADLALIIYGLLFYAALTNPWYPATLTLPGIAGMILTVGVAADANVVIFERIKEEVRGGKTIRSAVNSGYTKGFKTILDANAVTVITALVIFSVATAGVKGFALTLMIGVVISMFTAVLATRAMLALLADFKFFNNSDADGHQASEEGEEREMMHYRFHGEEIYLVRHLRRDHPRRPVQPGYPGSQPQHRLRERQPADRQLQP